MQKTVYFDTNVIDHLIKKKNGVTIDNKKLLRSLVKENKISIPLSIINLEEAFSALENYPDEARRQYLFLSELVDYNKIIKAPDQLLRDDIISYLKNNSSDYHFLDSSVIKFNIAELFNKKRIKEFYAILQKIKEEKTSFKLENVKSRGLVLSQKGEMEHIPTFKKYWEMLKIDFVKSAIEKVGILDKFKYRNIKGLLEVRSVRVWVGWSISYIYGQIFEKRTPKIGDSRDMKHAVLESSADIFVTHDRDLAKLIGRIPIKKFTIIGHVHELLRLF
jgi:hypothetical protein